VDRRHFCFGFALLFAIPGIRPFQCAAPESSHTGSPSRAHQRPRNLKYAGAVQHRESEKLAGRRGEIGRLEPPAEEQKNTVQVPGSRAEANPKQMPSRKNEEHRSDAPEAKKEPGGKRRKTA
jgi:hypothetical protein